MNKNLKKPGETRPLSPKQNRAVLLLAQGLTAEETSNRLKMSRGTLNNWRSQNRHFRQQLQTVQWEMFSSGIEQLKSLVSIAASTLAYVMNDQEAAHRDKIAAARTVLQHCDPNAIELTQQINNHNDVDDYLQRMGLQ